jgi:hypothetical protein
VLLAQKNNVNKVKNLKRSQSTASQFFCLLPIGTFFGKDGTFGSFFNEIKGFLLFLLDDV